MSPNPNEKRAIPMTFTPNSLTSSAYESCSTDNRYTDADYRSALARLDAIQSNHCRTSDSREKAEAA